MSALVHADERLRRDFAQVTLPLLVIHGGADKAARPEGSREFFEHAGASDKTLKIYDDGYHDLLNDLGREGVAADINHWLDQQIQSLDRS